IYTFAVATEGKTFSWAFQTKKQLRVQEAYPADRETGVDTDASLRLILNQMAAVDPASVPQYVTVEPYVSGTWQQQGRNLVFTPAGEWAPGTVYRVKIEPGLPLSDSSLQLAAGYECSFETAYAEESAWSISGEVAYLTGEQPAFALSGTDQVSAALYKYADASAYGKVLTNALAGAPLWSESCKRLHDADSSEAALAAEYVLTAEDGRVYLPQQPAAGYYLLRCSAEEMTQDVLFCVSDIAAWLTNDGDKMLLWLYDSKTDEPLTATIGDTDGNSLAYTGPDGTVVMPYDEQVYVISEDRANRDIVLPTYAGTKSDEHFYANWRYLYLDRDNYERDATVNFWGMVKPRDGSSLEYERVSVYIYSRDRNTIAYRGFAPLRDNVFSDSLSLPSLLDGTYSLQIWQSGRLLVERSFTVGGQDGGAAFSPQHDAEPVLCGLGNSYEIKSGIAADAYLFFASQGSIGRSGTGDSPLFEGIFEPDNYLNEYVTCVAYKDGRFTAEAPRLLLRDSSAAELSLKVSGALQEERAGDSGVLDITVTDAEGVPVEAALAVSIVKSEVMPQVDTFAGVFGDVTPDYTQAQAAPTAAESRGQSLFFAAVNADAEGHAQCPYELPYFSGSCWLIVQALDSKGLQAGCRVMEYGTGSIEPELTDVPEDAATCEDYRLEKLGEDTVLAEDDLLSIYGSEERMRMLAFLFDAVLAYEDNGPAEAAVAYDHARQLLMDYGGEQMFGLFGPAAALDRYQKQDGGLGDLDAPSSLELSVEAMAAAPGGIDYAALVAYYNEFLGSADRGSYILALAGMALYHQPVLQDIKLLLQEDDLSDHEYLMLLWAAYACGDEHPAELSFAQWTAGREAAE
ncbi:MAG: Ig-like domain-containing protein, partial [Firmicutes bacterium]|nr:Ig-like domain-containing protein [Bacillota bacterium]